MTRKRKWLTGIGAAIGIATVWLMIPRMAANAAPPAETAPAPVECTVTFAGTAEKGLTDGAESITTSFDIAPSVASCLDRRSTEANKIMGGTVTSTEPGTLSGNCAAPQAEIMAQVTWIYGTPMEKPDVSTLKVTSGMADGVPDLKAEVTSGPLRGWSVAAVPVSLDEVAASAELFKAACKTAAGAKYGVGAVTVSFREPTPTPPATATAPPPTTVTEPIETIEPVVPPAEPTPVSPGAPATDPAVPVEPVEPVAEPVMPVEPVKPVAPIADPAVEPVAPIAAPGEPVAVPAAPAQS